MGKLNSNLLKAGDKLSRTSYMTVIGTHKRSGVPFVDVENEDGKQWSIEGPITEDECYSANQFDPANSVKLSRTELINIFENVGDAIFTVNFDKLPTADDYLALTRGEGSKIISFDAMKKAFKKFKGENRTLVGYKVNTENGFGRSQVVDMEIPKGEHKLRLVDHRTINWLICKNIKYEVKK